ncbi:hypothetical protein D3C81_1591780 [compost metagenome]
MRVVVVIKPAQNIDELRTLHGVPADADCRGLADAARRQLMHRFICQRAAARNDADMTRQMDIPRHDSDLAFARRNHARTVRTDQNRLFSFHITFNLHHIKDRNAFRNTNDQIQFRFHSF